MKNKEPLQENVDCKNRIYKCKITSSMTKKGTIIYKTSMIPVHEPSCKECNTCGYMEDFLKDHVDDNDPPDILGYPQDGSLYLLELTEEPPDYYGNSGDSSTVLNFVKLNRVI